jgi:hypothetical protein
VKDCRADHVDSGCYSSPVWTRPASVAAPLAMPRLTSSPALFMGWSGRQGSGSILRRQARAGRNRRCEGRGRQNRHRGNGKSRPPARPVGKDRAGEFARWRGLPHPAGRALLHETGSASSPSGRSCAAAGRPSPAAHRSGSRRAHTGTIGRLASERSGAAATCPTTRSFSGPRRRAAARPSWTPPSTRPRPPAGGRPSSPGRSSPEEQPANLHRLSRLR